MLARREVVDLLGVRGRAQAQLFEESRRLRRAAFGDRVILRGVTEITNLCRVNCDFCPMRRDNTKVNEIFMLGQDDLVEAGRRVRDAGINVVFFQGGEIPQTTRSVGEAIPHIRRLFDDDVEILLNLGNKSRAEYAYLKDQGATTYILKHETSDAALNERMRHESLSERLRCLSDLVDLGYRVGTGMIVGLPGQSLESIADDILLAREYGVHMCSASPFVPAPGTPLEGQPYGSMDVTLNALALMRIVSPGWLVPSVSALEKTREDGQLDGLNAGANVITINFTDEAHRGQYLIYGRDRFIVRANYARELVARAGLVPSQSVFVGSGKFEPAAYEIDSGRGGDNLSRRASTQTAAASSRSSFPARPTS